MTPKNDLLHCVCRLFWSDFAKDAQARLVSAGVSCSFKGIFVKMVSMKSVTTKLSRQKWELSIEVVPSTVIASMGRRDPSEVPGMCGRTAPSDSCG